MSHLLHCSCTMVYRGLPWYTMVYDGMPTMVHHGLRRYDGKPWYIISWYTMVNHGISYRCTMVYHGT